MLLAAGWLAPDRWSALAMGASIVLVWIAELFNSGIEALADSITTSAHPLIGRAKDMGSAAVMLSLCLVVVTCPL